VSSSGTLRVLAQRATKQAGRGTGMPASLQPVGPTCVGCPVVSVQKVGCTSETTYGIRLGRATRQVTGGGEDRQVKHLSTYNRRRRRRTVSTTKQIFSTITRPVRQPASCWEMGGMSGLVSTDWRAQDKTCAGVINAVDGMDGEETQSAERRAAQNACWARCRKDSEVDCGAPWRRCGGRKWRVVLSEQKERTELESWRCCAGGKHD
jgi:hypothetical protein